MMQLIKIALLAFLFLLPTGCSRAPKGHYAGLQVLIPDYLEPILAPAAEQFERENRTPVRLVRERPENILTRIRSDSSFDAFITTESEDLPGELRDSLGMSPDYSCSFWISFVLAGRVDGPRTDDLKRLKEDAFVRILVRDPQSGYEGQLAQELLADRHLWTQLQPKLITVTTSDRLLSFLRTGEADAAILMETSLANEKGWVVMQRLDEQIGMELVHCGMVTAYSQKPQPAQAFIDLLDSRLCEIYKLKGVYQFEEDN